MKEFLSIWKQVSKNEVSVGVFCGVDFVGWKQLPRWKTEFAKGLKFHNPQTHNGTPLGSLAKWETSLRPAADVQVADVWTGGNVSGNGIDETARAEVDFVEWSDPREQDAAKQNQMFFSPRCMVTCTFLSTVCLGGSQHSQSYGSDSGGSYVFSLPSSDAAAAVADTLR